MAWEGRLRLSGVPNTLSGIGRVEVCHNRLWGLICTYYWTQAASRVVCRQLGFNASYALWIKPDMVKEWEAAKIYTHPAIGRVRWLRQLYCDGTESSIQNCTGETATPPNVFAYLPQGSNPPQCADPWDPPTTWISPRVDDYRREVVVVACFGTYQRELCLVLSRVHKNKSMQHHTLGSGKAEFQVT